MSGQDKVERIAQLLETLARDVDALEEAGAGVPAVEKNAVRLRGTLRALQIQFQDLAGFAPLR